MRRLGARGIVALAAIPFPYLAPASPQTPSEARDTPLPGILRAKQRLDERTAVVALSSTPGGGVKVRAAAGDL